jgi:hypothetical protein
MSLKIDIINNAYKRARISGLTVQPTGEDVQLALDRLESMVAEWDSINIDIGYKFETTPDPNTPHNVPRKYWNALETNLTLRILADFNKQVHPTLMAEQRTSYSSMIASTAQVNRAAYPSRQPVGSGNRLAGRSRRYYGEDSTLPVSSAIEKLQVGEINDYTYSFADYLLQSETISTYSVVAGDGLTLLSEVLVSSVISYQLEAVSSQISTTLEIEIETTGGRKEKRTIYFEVSE